MKFTMTPARRVARICARMNSIKTFLAALTLLVVTNLFAAVNVAELRVEHRSNPLGIDSVQPRLSWQLATDERDVKQTACQILVASSATKLAADTGDLWDSGKVKTSASVLVSYAGKQLASHTECFWKVRVWTNGKKVSAWSAPAKWTMGILSDADWRAQWIGQDGAEQTNVLRDTSWIWFPEGEPNISAPSETNYFRRVITIPAGRTIKRAIWQYTGDNECRGWLNEFDLGARNSTKTVKWADITTRLESGKTYLFGHTGRNDGANPSPAGVIGKLTVDFTDGEPLVITTDEQWKVSKTEEPGWNTLAFDDSKWVAAQVLGPAGMKPWGDARIPENRRQPARWLRKEFSVEKKVSRATVYFSGLGLSELYLNGAKVGDAVLSPALAQYDQRQFYVTYDVTAQVRSGANALGAVLGGGRYYADRSKVYAGTVSWGWPKLRLQLRVEYTDGTVSEVVSDASWKLSLDGPILANSEYDGEEYDARKELAGWSNAGFDDSKWQPAQLASTPGGQLGAQMQQPIRVTGKIKPIAVREQKPGVFIFDMGQNMVGWCQLTVRGAAGETVQLRHAETLQPDGSLYMANLRGARVTDSYTLRGGDPEVWQPRFTYHGFRYVEVTGFPGTPTVDALEGEVVNDDLPVAGDFLCSNDMINRIYTNIVWGTRGNYRSIPTDCPQRDERQGWLGDRSEECKGEAYLFDISTLYSKWRQDMTDSQRSNGSIPDVSPASWPIYNDDVIWPSSAIIIPSALERQFGDAAPIARDYASAKLWMDHMQQFVKDGLINKDQYGDWCVPPEDLKLIHSKDPARQTAKPLLATSYFYYDLRLMEKYAQQLGQKTDAQHWAQLAEEVKLAFNKKFLDRQKGIYDNGSQTSCVLPLAFGLVPDDLKSKIFAHLVDKIEHETKGHIGTGLVGGQYLNRVLSDGGRADLCYAFAAEKEYPSWGYMVTQGATTIWELWNGNTADPTMNSGNHVMLIGDLVIWFYEYVAGIAPDDAAPGFKHIIMRPTLVGDLKFARAAHRSPYGLITSEWHRSDKTGTPNSGFDWQIEIPANTTATIQLPKNIGAHVTLDGKKVKQPTKPLELGSGKYQFHAE
jgi:alpha-L-rhamnosidase